MIRSSARLAALAWPLFAAVPAAAGGSLEARYSVTFTGIPIGQAALVVQVNDEGYSASGSAMVAGALKMISPGKGSAAARGLFVDGKVAPVSYSVNSESRKRSEEIRLSGAAGMIRDEVVIPRRERSDQVPVTEEHRTGAVDPMSAIVMPVQNGGDLTGVEACERTLPIYDGRERYDLDLIYVRTDRARDVKGYSGPLAVCRVQYRPVAGHRPNRKQVRELAENKEIFVWLAPVAGTRVVVPQRVSFGTPLGVFMMQATHFSSEERPAGDARPAVR